uniref:Uncharacterized protein n=1 Tax=Arion vulgaris TaxID=1028688 RepID=A0A0B7ASW2_9EUPU
MKSFGIDVDNWENIAQDRSDWGTLLRYGSSACKAGRTARMVLQPARQVELQGWNRKDKQERQ